MNSRFCCFRFVQASSYLSKKSLNGSVCRSLRPFSTIPEQTKFASFKGTFTKYFRKYGVTFVGTYLTIYVATLGSIYLALDFDVFRAADFGFDAKTLTEKACENVEYYTGIKTLPEYIRQHPWAGVMALAWVMTKFTEPFRLGAAILLVPRIARMLRR